MHDDIRQKMAITPMEMDCREADIVSFRPTQWMPNSAIVIPHRSGRNRVKSHALFRQGTAIIPNPIVKTTTSNWLMHTIVKTNGA